MSGTQTQTSISSITLQPSGDFDTDGEAKFLAPKLQDQLLLHGPKQAFELTQGQPVPELKNDGEVLIRIQTISLNPVDWKGPAFNFGLPSLPCVLGRDLAGVVIKAPKRTSRLKVGDTVSAISTDYRDYRKAAFQQYAVASDFNTFRIPVGVRREAASASGVAFVTAALTLGICLGLAFDEELGQAGGPDLFRLIRSLDKSSLPEDIRAECFESLDESDRLTKGNWLAIWGASTTVGFFILQLAKIAGIKVICIADAIKHGELLVGAGADVLVHRKNTDEATEIVRSVSGHKLRFAVDTIGKETAGLLQSTLAATQVGQEPELQKPRAHLVGIAAGPKEPSSSVQQHKVPVKLFHESPVVGDALVNWMERLLLAGKLQLPRVDLSEISGLHGVNPGLDRLKEGSMSGQRIVVNI